MNYDQLSPEAKVRARECCRESLNDGEWWESVYEMWEEKLTDLGFSDAKIQFRGFSCQGDGASFTSGITKEFPLPESLVTQFAEAKAVAQVQRRFAGKSGDVDLFHEISFSIQRDIHTRYVYPRTISAECKTEFSRDVPDDLREAVETWAEGMRGELTATARELSEEIFRDLESEWDHRNTDEFIESELRENEHWDFDEDGDYQFVAPPTAQAA